MKFLKNSIFNFCVHDKSVNISTENKIKFGKYFFYFDSRTPINKCVLNNRNLLIFGLAVNVCNGEDKDIAKKILQSTSSLDEVIAYEKKLGGKYLIFYSEDEQYYVIPDATASIPFFYNVGSNEIICSSVMEYIAKSINLSEDFYLKKIRNSSDVSQAMPFDVTEYKEIKQLLPNHYYSFSTQSAKRFIDNDSIMEEITPDIAAQLTMPFIGNMVKYYDSHFKLYCPITSGRDSRVVLAFLRKYVESDSFKSYTIKHTEHNGNEDDLVIPMKIAQKSGLEYCQIEDALPSEILIQSVDSIYGVNKYSKRTLTIANTVFQNYSDGAIVNGDIIGQIGKCSLHRDIPHFLATEGYFRCKLHNYSKESKKFLKNWLDEIRMSGEMMNTFDLFSIENRMGRWASQQNSIYSLLGQVNLNIFNSRSIISQWICVNRSKRKKSLIHLELLKLTNVELLEYPFEKDANFVETLAKSTGVLYYIFSYVKYVVEKLLFNVNKKV